MIDDKYMHSSAIKLTEVIKRVHKKNTV